LSVLLARSNKVTLVWVPDYNGIAGNELTDALVGEVSTNALTVLEIVCGFTEVTAYGFVCNWVKRKQ
jgi:hypothetical protein